MHQISKVRSQSGLSLLGMLFWGVALVCIGVVVAQVVPTVVEYQAILKAAKQARQGATVAEVRLIFERQQTIDNFKSVQAKDLEIQKVGDKVVVSFAYNKEIHLAGPAYLLLKYSGSSD